MKYREDLRERVIKYANSHTVKKTSEVFGVGRWIIFEWRRRLRETGSLKASALNRKPRKLDMEGLRVYVGKHPGAYLREMAAEFGVCVGCISNGLKRMKITLKKKRGVSGSGTRKSVRSTRGSYPTTQRKP